MARINFALSGHFCQVFLTSQVNNSGSPSASRFCRLHAAMASSWCHAPHGVLRNVGVLLRG